MDKALSVFRLELPVLLIEADYTGSNSHPAGKLQSIPDCII
jgi:hypothetical protein